MSDHSDETDRVEIDEQLSGSGAIGKVRELLANFRAGMLLTRAADDEMASARSRMKELFTIRTRT